MDLINSATKHYTNPTFTQKPADSVDDVIESAREAVERTQQDLDDIEYLIQTKGLTPQLAADRDAAQAALTNVKDDYSKTLEANINYLKNPTTANEIAVNSAALVTFEDEQPATIADGRNVDPAAQATMDNVEGALQDVGKIQDLIDNEKDPTKLPELNKLLAIATAAAAKAQGSWESALLDFSGYLASPSASTLSELNGDAAAASNAAQGAVDAYNQAINL